MVFIKKEAVSFVFAVFIAAAPVAGVLAQTESGTQAAPAAEGESANSAAMPQSRPGALKERREAIKEKREAVGDKRKEIREEVKVKREERRENIGAKRQEAQKRIAEKRKEQIRRHFANMIGRLEAALEREKKLGERIQSRIDRARANGKDVTRAQAALDKAKGIWQEGRAALDEAKGRIEGVISSQDPKAAFKEVQDIIARARDKIKAVHAGLVEAITALRGIGEGAKKPESPSSVTPAPVPAPSPAPVPTPAVQ